MERYKVVASTKNLLIEREATFSHRDDALAAFSTWQDQHQAVRIIDIETRAVWKQVCRVSGPATGQ